MGRMIVFGDEGEDVTWDSSVPAQVAAASSKFEEYRATMSRAG